MTSMGTNVKAAKPLLLLGNPVQRICLCHDEHHFLVNATQIWNLSSEPAVEQAARFVEGPCHYPADYMFVETDTDTGHLAVSQTADAGGSLFVSAELLPQLLGLLPRVERLGARCQHATEKIPETPVRRSLLPLGVFAVIVLLMLRFLSTAVYTPAGVDGHTLGQLYPQFHVPSVLTDVDVGTLYVVNDWHYPMLADHDRAEFYQTMLKDHIRPGKTVVLDMGAGSGLLSIMAARLGAARVYAVESNPHLARIARKAVSANGVAGKVKVINKISTLVLPGDLDNQKPDVLVAELWGTLLLSENADIYTQDARNRLLAPDASVLPSVGTQYIQLVESEELTSLTSSSGLGGIDLRAMDALRNTVQMRFSKEFGIRFSSLEQRMLSDPVAVSEVDLEGSPIVSSQTMVSTRILRDGYIHAIVASWDVWPNASKQSVLSTHPNQTSRTRDLQWGQAIQICETPILVRAGEVVHLRVAFSGGLFSTTLLPTHEYDDDI